VERDLINALLNPDRATRLSVRDAGFHAFFEGVDVFSLHQGKPVELQRGEVAPNPGAAWSRRQNSSIWAPMPQEYTFSAQSYSLNIIEETSSEASSPFVPLLKNINELHNFGVDV